MYNSDVALAQQPNVLKQATYAPSQTSASDLGLGALVFVGAFFGFKAKLADPPTRTNEIPRQIPSQAWYMGATFNVLMGGILPFGAIFIELFFIMTSVGLQP